MIQSAMIASSAQGAQHQQQQQQRCAVSSRVMLIPTCSATTPTIGAARFVLMLGTFWFATGGPSAVWVFAHYHDLHHHGHRENLALVVSPKAALSPSVGSTFSIRDTPLKPCRAAIFAPGLAAVYMSMDLQTSAKTSRDGGNALTPPGPPAALRAPARFSSSSSSSAASAAVVAVSVYEESDAQKVAGDDYGTVGKLDRDTRAAKDVVGAVGSLPGTWWTAGLPKWMYLVRRRMLTKEDFFHIHAASGMLYLVGGSLWLAYVMGLEVIAGVPQIETGTPIPLLLLGAGLVNVLSSIPMANTRSWVLNGLCVSVMQLWYVWHVSDAYPAYLHVADPWFAAVGLSILAIAYVEVEEDIFKDRRERELVREAGQRWRPGGKILFYGDDYGEGNAIQRYGAIANIVFNGPHLYATLVGGDWVDRLSEVYPLAPTLLFHSYFALAVGSSLALLAPTLYSRRLITAREMSLMQAITIAPVIMGMVDAAVMGSGATNNPLELYLGFLR